MPEGTGLCLKRQGVRPAGPAWNTFSGDVDRGPGLGTPFPRSDTRVPVTFAPGPAAPPATLPAAGEGSRVRREPAATDAEPVPSPGRSAGGKRLGGTQPARRLRAQPPARVPRPLHTRVPPARRCWNPLSHRRHARAPASRFWAARCRRRMSPWGAGALAAPPGL